MSVLCMPVRSPSLQGGEGGGEGGSGGGSKILGVVQVLNKLDDKLEVGGSGDIFTPEDERLLATFCSSLSGALESMANRHKDKVALSKSVVELKDHSTQLQAKDARLRLVEEAAVAEGQAHHERLVLFTQRLLRKYLGSREQRFLRLGWSTWSREALAARRLEADTRAFMGHVKAVLHMMMHRSLMRGMQKWWQATVSLRAELVEQEAGLRRVAGLMVSRTQRSVWGAMNRWMTMVADSKLFELEQELEDAKEMTLDEARQRGKRAAEMAVVKRELGNARRTEELMHSITHMAGKLVEADRASFFVADPQRGELWSEVSQNSNRIVVSADRSIVGQCLKHGTILNVPDARAHRLFDSRVDRDSGYEGRLGGGWAAAGRWQEDSGLQHMV